MTSINVLRLQPYQTVSPARSWNPEHALLTSLFFSQSFKYVVWHFPLTSTS